MHLFYFHLKGTVNKGRFISSIVLSSNAKSDQFLYIAFDHFVANNRNRSNKKLNISEQQLGLSFRFADIFLILYKELYEDRSLWEAGDCPSGIPNDVLRESIVHSSNEKSDRFLSLAVSRVWLEYFDIGQYKMQTADRVQNTD